MFSTKIGFEIENIYIFLNIRSLLCFHWLIFYSRFNYVVLPEQDRLKEKVEADLLSEGRYEKE